MAKFLFLMSHLGSNSNDLFEYLKQHPNIDGFKTDLIYDDLSTLDNLKQNHHKLENSASVYMDEILHNYRFQKNILNIDAKFIFYFGEPRSSINNIELKNPLAYYSFRLQGMYEYIIRTKGFVIHWNNWRLEELNKYLKINIKNDPQKELVNKKLTSYDNELRASKAYDDLCNLLNRI